jgi:glycosyltransferase involved in cell wall biosynthesis
VILVDGHSVDGTAEVARRVMPGIEIVQQTRKGKGNALACGFAAATGDIIVMFDADGSADASEIPAYVDALVKGADVAKGSRFLTGGGSEDITRFRDLGNKGLNWLTNALLGTRYTDLCYGYNAFWTDAVRHFRLPDIRIGEREGDAMLWGDGFEIETILNCRIAAAHLVVTEVPSVERRRIHGVSNLNAVTDGFRVLRTILEERRRRTTTMRRQYAPYAALDAEWSTSPLEAFRSITAPRETTQDARALSGVALNSSAA